VIDYDATNKCYYVPVDLDSREVLIRAGLDPSESDPRFHQQMVYAVIMRTIGTFEFALGRKVKWRRDTGPKSDPYHGKLRVFPHGMEDANAFYDPNLRALVFGYFRGGTTDVGANLPGQTVFTCLSHDIIVHETTHAIIDGLREKFTTVTGPDTAAFHEAFADIVALFQHFSYKDVLRDAVRRTKGYIHRLEFAAQSPAEGGPAIQEELAETNPLVGLAQQFGEALGTRKVLRSALGTPPNTRALENTLEPHARGSILVAAVFDAFFSIYLKRTRDLMRVARAVSASGDLHSDLVERIADEATKLARQFCTMCIRALDYCPPIDITMGEFLRALITADSDLVQEDPWGYRAAIIEAFRSRGIVPDDVGSYSEEALRWCPPELVDPKQVVKPCEGLQANVLADSDSGDAQHNARILYAWAKEHREALGLSKNPFRVFSFHPLHRIGPDGRLVFDFVVEFLQEHQEPLDPKNPKSREFTFSGGSTVILNQRGEIRYSILKRVESKTRLERQRNFYLDNTESSVLSPYVTPSGMDELNLSAIHRGF
jgi:hypothetical protein